MLRVVNLLSSEPDSSQAIGVNMTGFRCSRRSTCLRTGPVEALGSPWLLRLAKTVDAPHGAPARGCFGSHPVVPPSVELDELDRRVRTFAVVVDLACHRASDPGDLLAGHPDRGEVGAGEQLIRPRGGYVVKQPKGEFS